MRLRELAIKHKTALNNQLDSLLLEFNIRSSARTGGLLGAIESTLEADDNALSTEFRSALSASWEQYLSVLKVILTHDESLLKAISSHPECKRLLKLEGVGTLMRLVCICRLAIVNLVFLPRENMFQHALV
jgi:transposase